jgi:hypothetical protein
MDAQRAARKKAADEWWEFQRVGKDISLKEHAKAHGIAVPTLKKALTEFPEQPEPAEAAS